MVYSLSTSGKRSVNLLQAKQSEETRNVQFTGGSTYIISLRACRNALTLKHDLNNNIAEKIEKKSTITIKMFETAIESLFRQNYNAAERIIENIKEIIESARRTTEHACDITETVLNLNVDSILL